MDPFTFAWQDSGEVAAEVAAVASMLSMSSFQGPPEPLFVNSRAMEQARARRAIRQGPGNEAAMNWGNQPSRNAH